MKTIHIISSIAAACVIIGSAVYAGNVSLSESQIGMRTTDIYSENNTTPDGTHYHTETPGTSKRFQRAYENAPPMIPHDISDLGEIDKNNNACLGCHMPDVAKDVGATPIPKTHFTNFRPLVSVDASGNFQSESNNKIIKRDLKDQLYEGRYNCTQCHAPQSEGNLRVKNDFKPDFTEKKGEQHKNHSYLLDELDIGVKVDNGL